MPVASFKAFTCRAGNRCSEKSFWCNAYNALTSFLIIRFKLKGTMLANFPIYFVPKIKIGRQKFSLDDIEHGILRQNKRAPHSLGGSSPQAMKRIC